MPTKEEWTIAHQKLDDQPDGTKLPYSCIVNKDGKLAPRPKRPHLHSQYQTTHSFIKLNGIIYAISPGKSLKAVVGQGGEGIVKFIRNENGALLTVKISPKQHYKCAIMHDIGFELGHTTERGDKKKFYSIMPYLGVSLAKILMQNGYKPGLCYFPPAPEELLNPINQRGLRVKLCANVPQLEELDPGLLYICLKNDQITACFMEEMKPIELGIKSETLGDQADSIKEAIRSHKTRLSPEDEEAFIHELNESGYYFTLLNTNPLTDEQRLDLGISCCLQVYRLHAGLSSKTKQSYAHLDVKPANFTVSEDHLTHLVDFNFAVQDANVKEAVLKGTHIYESHQFNSNKYTRGQRDEFALRRTIYLPPLFIDLSHKWIRCTETICPSILDSRIVKTYGLLPNLDSKDGTYRDQSPLTLAALLIAAKLKLYNYKDIVADDNLALSLVSLYKNPSLQNVFISALKEEKNYILATLKLLVRYNLLHHSGLLTNQAACHWIFHNLSSGSLYTAKMDAILSAPLFLEQLSNFPNIEPRQLVDNLRQLREPANFAGQMGGQSSFFYNPMMATERNHRPQLSSYLKPIAPQSSFF